MSVLYTVCGRGAGSARSDSRLRGNDVMGACMEAEAREMNGAVVCRTSPNIHSAQLWQRGSVDLGLMCISTPPTRDIFEGAGASMLYPPSVCVFYLAWVAPQAFWSSRHVSTLRLRDL